MGSVIKNIAEITDPRFGKAFGRISKALHDHSKTFVNWVTPEQADAVIIHVVGGEQYNTVQQYLNKAIIVQHCYLTADPGRVDYCSQWEKALLTISYQDLTRYTKKKFNFFHTPWGYEPSIFHYTGEEKDIKVFATGHVAHTECLDVMHTACKRTNHVMYHTGEDFKYDPRSYHYLKYLDDAAFARMLNKTQYTSCLRRLEGFEMMGIEGAACGAAPIVLDSPSYSWYKDIGITLEENKDLEEQLIPILLNTPKIVDQQKIKEFQWKPIITNIFNAIFERLG